MRHLDKAHASKAIAEIISLIDLIIATSTDQSLFLCSVFLTCSLILCSVFVCVPTRTALILACESSCKEAVEILLKTKADVSAVDIYGHDAYHYARLSQKQDLITLVQHALEKNTKGNMFLVNHFFPVF